MKKCCVYNLHVIPNLTDAPDKLKIRWSNGLTSWHKYMLKNRLLKLNVWHKWHFFFRHTRQESMCLFFFLFLTTEITILLSKCVRCTFLQRIWFEEKEREKTRAQKHKWLDNRTVRLDITVCLFYVVVVIVVDINNRNHALTAEIWYHTQFDVRANDFCRWQLIWMEYRLQGGRHMQFANNNLEFTFFTRKLSWLNLRYSE